MNTTSSKDNPMARVMSLGDFRLLFAGASASLLGDQFALIATPWLVLQLTKDPLALGIVMALEGFPRALFMLFGGVLSDYLSPRLMMLLANVTRFFLTAIMAILVFTGAVQLWMIYAFALAFGIVAGFAIPAENSIVPMLVEEQDLQAGNSLMMGITQLAGFVGPTIAGILIGQLSGSFLGIALAYAIDALSFVISAISLQLIRSSNENKSSTEQPVKESVWESMRVGIEFVWADKALSLVFKVLIAVNFLLIGPLLVGIPVLADQRLPEGATAFGILMSAFAGGNLLGYLLAGSLPRPDGTRMRWIMTMFFTCFGVIIAMLGVTPSTWVDFGLLFLLGMGNGYIAILLITWMQIRTPKEMLGRIMSLFVLSSTGLVPISQAIAGAVSKWNLSMLFAIPGGLVLLVTVWMSFHPDLAGLSDGISAVPAEG